MSSAAVGRAAAAERLERSATVAIPLDAFGLAVATRWIRCGAVS
jgi:hypothetical protein